MVDDEQNKNEKSQVGLGREHKRVDFFRQVKVTLEDDSSMDVFASNVSKGGMFVRSNQPLSPGQKVSLAFDTDQGNVEVEEGEVRWSKEFEPISIDGTTPGMGIEFKKIAPESQNKIEAFIDEILQEDNNGASTATSISAEQDQTLSAANASQGPSLFDQLPDSKPRVVTGIEPEPIRAPIRQPEPINQADSEISAAEAAFMSDGQANTGSDPSTPAHSEPYSTPSRIQLQLSDSQENYLSAPPKPTTRVFLFVGFVFLVAAGTFSVLTWLKPSTTSSNTVPNELETPNASALASSPEVTISQAESQQVQPNQPKSDQAQTDPAKPDETRTAHTRPDQAQPESTQPLRTQPDEPVSAKPKLAKSDNTKPTKTKVQPTKTTKDRTKKSQIKVAEAKSSRTVPKVDETESTARAPITLAAPRFRKTSRGWQMTVKASQPLRIRYFTLNDPARLVIDAHQAGYSGKQHLESPVPFIHKVRFGTKPDSTRLVLDFSGKKIPVHKVEHTKDTICVSFED